MVWKKSNIKKTDKYKRKLHNPYHEDAKLILKSCLKHTLDASSDPESSKKDSHGESGSGSSIKDHGLARSVASRLSVSTNSSRSVDSRRVPSVEQLSCTDDSSIDIHQYSQNCERTSQAGPQHEAKKKVRFNAIQIRDYERVVGDNPSCTSGPPLSIGWKYQKTAMIDINSYEMTRPYRKQCGCLLLSREEREALLLNWGASFHDIVESVRGNLRVKNQRRQTVTNLGRTERIEEAFESATRKLKRALLLRRSTGNKVKRLQEQADLAQSALNSLKIAEERALNEIRRGPIATGQEPDKDSLDVFNLDVAVANVARSALTENNVCMSGHSASRFIVSEEEDYYNSFDGLTVSGNITTPSQLELERFYRELELEMFGDEELPSMVGQTLEFPSGIRSGKRGEVETFGSNVAGLDDSLNSGISLHTSKLSRFFSEDELAVLSKSKEEQVSEVTEDSLRVGDLDAALELEQNRSMISRSLLEDDEMESSNSDDGTGRVEFDAYHGPLNRMYPIYGDYLNSRYYTVCSRLSGSFASTEHSDACLTHSMLAMTQQFSRLRDPSHPQVPLQAGMTMFQDGALFGGRNESRKKKRSWIGDTNAGPRIQHHPLPTHLSPSFWMDDSDSLHGRYDRGYQTITISEDCDASEAFFSGMFHHGLRCGSRYVDPAKFAPV